MGNISAGSEVVQVGIQIEKNGKDFYNALAKHSKNPKAVEIFKYLAGEEEKHIKAFQKILDKTENYEPQGLDADQYINAMVERTKNLDPSQFAKVLKSALNEN